MLHILTKLLISTTSTNIRTSQSSRTQRLQVFLLRNWLRRRTLEMDSIKWAPLLTTQNNQPLDKETQNSISQPPKSTDNCSNRPTMLITTNVGHRIQDLVYMISIRWDKSNLTHLDRIRFSRVAFQIVKIRKKVALLQAQELIKPSNLSKKKPTTILETILTVCLLVKSQRVSSPKQKEENFGSTKVQHLTPDKPSPRIQGLDNMNTRRRKTTLKTKSFKKRQSTQPSTAAILAQWTKKSRHQIQGQVPT